MGLVIHEEYFENDIVRLEKGSSSYLKCIYIYIYQELSRQFKEPKSSLSYPSSVLAALLNQLKSVMVS